MKQYYSDYDEYIREERDRNRGANDRDTSGAKNSPRGRNLSPEQKQTQAKRKKNLNRIFIYAILAAIVGAFGYFVFFYDSEKTIAMTETPITASMTKLDIGSGMLYQDGQTLNYYDWTKSSRNYSIDTEVSRLRMTGSENLAVVYTDTVLQFVDSKIQREFNGTILSVECGENHIAVLWRNSSDKDSIVILDKEGQQVDQLLADDAYIINFGFYIHGSEMLWMQSLSLTASTPVTSVTTYDLTKHANIGVMQIQDQLIDSFYFTDDSIFAAGINQIIRYTYDNQEMYREMIYGYKVIDFSSGSGTPTFLLAPREGDMNAVRLLTLQEEDESDATDTHLQLSSEGVAGYIMNGSLLVLTENKAYTYSLLGKLSEESSLERPAVAAEKISDSMLLVLSGDTYYTAKIG